MKTADLSISLKNYKHGTFVRLKYKKDLSKGYTKVTEVTTRLGVHYSHINGVEVAGKADYAVPVDEAKIVYKNVKNGTLYVQHEPLEAEARKITWVKNGVVVSEETARTELPKSTFVDSDYSKVKRVKVENIISIGG